MKNKLKQGFVSFLCLIIWKCFLRGERLSNFFSKVLPDYLAEIDKFLGYKWLFWRKIGYFQVVFVGQTASIYSEKTTYRIYIRYHSWFQTGSKRRNITIFVPKPTYRMVFSAKYKQKIRLNVVTQWHTFLYSYHYSNFGYILHRCNSIWWCF